MCYLMDTEIEILNKGNGIGNQVLYNLCEDYRILKSCEENYIDGLAAQMWLIGRSYAASPERRSYGVLTGTKIEYKNSGNGLDDYFDKLAKELIDNYNSKPRATFWSYLKNPDDSKAYNLDNSQYDLDQLKNSISSVILFNRLLKEIRFNIDENDLRNHIDKYKENYQNNYGNIDEDEILEILKNNSRNMISFCSKFLHFHFPDTVFIIDSITESHFKGRTEYIFSFKSVDESGNTSFENSKIKITKTAVDEIIDKLDLKEFDFEPERKYVKHCVREYLVAAEINKSHQCIWEGKYIPRVVDTYMLIANSK